jgi:hypothetical protein
VEAGESPALQALLPEGGGVTFRAADSSLGSVTVRRRGEAIELIRDGVRNDPVSRIEFSSAPERLKLYRIVVNHEASDVGASEAGSLQMGEDRQGAVIALHLPETLWNAALGIVPEAGEADYPVWVGRWAR